MQHRLALVALGLFLLMTFSVNGLSSAQTADLPFPDTGEVPPSDADGVVTSEKEGEPASADILPPDRNLAVTAISDLRDEVRLFPGHTDARVHLAQRLYLIGDLDAAAPRPALDPSRITLRTVRGFLAALGAQGLRSSSLGRKLAALAASSASSTARGSSRGTRPDRSPLPRSRGRSRRP